jgi:hypothetical protein
MVQFEIENDKMKEWFPITYETFIQELRNSQSKSSDKKEDKIKWILSWGIFRTKAKNKNEQEKKDKLHLTYDERCEVDLPKIRITVTMKAGNRIVSDRSIDDTIPDFIEDMFFEVMKIKMLQEQMIVNDPVVLESLEEFKHLLEYILEEMAEEGENIDIIRNLKKETPLSMDEILDKISESGMQSLTAKELKFLEKMSRG